MNSPQTSITSYRQYIENCEIVSRLEEQISNLEKQIEEQHALSCELSNLEKQKQQLGEKIVYLEVQQEMRIKLLDLARKEYTEMQKSYDPFSTNYASRQSLQNAIDSVDTAKHNHSKACEDLKECQQMYLKVCDLISQSEKCRQMCLKMRYLICRLKEELTVANEKSKCWENSDQAKEISALENKIYKLKEEHKDLQKLESLAEKELEEKKEKANYIRSQYDPFDSHRYCVTESICYQYDYGAISLAQSEKCRELECAELELTRLKKKENHIPITNIFGDFPDPIPTQKPILIDLLLNLFPEGTEGYERVKKLSQDDLSKIEKEKNTHLTIPRFLESIFGRGNLETAIKRYVDEKVRENKNPNITEALLESNITSDLGSFQVYYRKNYDWYR